MVYAGGNGCASALVRPVGFQRLGRSDQSGEHFDGSADPAFLIVVSGTFGEACGLPEIGRSDVFLAGEQHPREPTRFHEGVTDSGNVVMVMVVLEENRLPQKVAERDSESGC